MITIKSKKYGIRKFMINDSQVFERKSIYIDGDKLYFWQVIPVNASEANLRDVCWNWLKASE